MRMIRIAQLTEKLNVSRSTVYRLEESGELPPRRRISPNASGWIEEEIDEFIATRPTLRSCPGEEDGRP